MTDIDRLMQSNSAGKRVIAENAKYILSLEKELARLRAIVEGLECLCGGDCGDSCQVCRAKREMNKEVANG